MALINTAIKPFKATAFKDGEFVDVSSEDIKGKWAVFVFYPADFTFVCPTELGDIADKYEELQSRGVEVLMGHSFLIQQSLAGETVLQNNQSILAQFSSFNSIT